MPWSPAQHRLFAWAATNPGAARSAGYSIKQSDARRMMGEGIKKRVGGLAQFADGGMPDNIPMYALPQFSQIPPMAMPELTQIEQMRPLAGMRYGGRLRFAGGGTIPTIGSEVDTGMAGDPRMDPRSRVLAEINDRIQKQSSLSSANQSTLSIMGRLRGPQRPTLPHLTNPWAAYYLSHTPFDVESGYGRYPLPEQSVGQYADGGEVDDPSFIRQHPWLSAGAAGLGAGALRPRLVNALARPFARALARPELGMEAVSRHPLSGMQSDARYNIAREASQHEYGNLPVWRGQGAWQGDKGMEFNPLYSQRLPRTMGRVIDDPESMRYASQMGENLEQQATPVSRFVPHLWNTDEGANAMMVHGMDSERLKRLAEILGPDIVTAHRPGNKAMVFPTGDRSMRSITDEVNAGMNFPKIRYGKSDPLTDRVMLTREPADWGNGTYGKFGARPRSQAYDAFERAILSDPRVERGESAWNFPK